jgi:anti-anti-sigma factor
MRPEPSTTFIPATEDMTDWRSVRDFQARCESSLQHTRRRVVLDLTQVAWADSKLVACLIIAVKRARARSLRLEIKPSRPVRSWISVCHLEDVLPPSSTE